VDDLRRTDFKTGHCSLVAVLGHPQNTEAPIPAATDWASFLDLVRNTKNVTWRNFHVVEVLRDRDPQVGDGDAGREVLGADQQSPRLGRQAHLDGRAGLWTAGQPGPRVRKGHGA
jgi:hypothetical protein